MPVWVWGVGDESSFEVAASADFATFELGGAIAAKQRVCLPSRVPNWVAVVNGAQYERLVSDLGDASEDRGLGIPQPPPPYPDPANPAGMHVTPLNQGRTLYLSAATPRARGESTSSESHDATIHPGTH